MELPIWPGKQATSYPWDMRVWGTPTCQEAEKVLWAEQEWKGGRMPEKHS